MNEEQVRKLIQDGLNEKVRPLIENMVKLISDAYGAGIEVGIKIAKGDGNREEEIGVAEPPSKTFPHINEFDNGSSYRR